MKLNSVPFIRLRAFCHARLEQFGSGLPPPLGAWSTVPYAAMAGRRMLILPGLGPGAEMCAWPVANSSVSPTSCTASTGVWDLQMFHMFTDVPNS